MFWVNFNLLYINTPLKSNTWSKFNFCCVCFLMDIHRLIKMEGQSDLRKMALNYLKFVCLLSEARSPLLTVGGSAFG